MSSRSATRSASATARSVSSASSGIVGVLHDVGEQLDRRGRVARRHRDRPAEALRARRSPPTLPPSSSASSAICARRAARRALERRARQQRREPGVRRRLVARAAERVDAHVHDRRARLAPHEDRHAARRAKHAHAAPPRARARSRVCTARRGDRRRDRRRRERPRRRRRRAARASPSASAATRRRVARPVDDDRRLLGIEIPARERRAPRPASPSSDALEVLARRSASRRAPPTRRGSSPGLPSSRAGAPSAPRTCAARARAPASLDAVLAQRAQLRPDRARRVGRALGRRLRVHDEHAELGRRVVVRATPTTRAAARAPRGTGATRGPPPSTVASEVERRRVGVRASAACASRTRAASARCRPSSSR